jgi:hypothetical protein
MNELQIRLTADIKDLQSALNKAKATIKSFESETATDSEKSNVGFRRKIGLIEQLTAKAKALKVSLSQATNEQQIAKFNAELEQTNQELARLNALGKSFANPAVKSFNNLKSSVGAANGSAVAFNRIIQDAPFGLLGVGNNIQQFTEQLAFLKQTQGSTGAALKSFFGSLFTSTNLLILGVSALTAGLTAYQMGAFDSAEETRDLNKELDNFKNSLDGVSKAQLEGAQSAQKEIQALQLLRLQAENDGISREKRLLAVKELKKEWPEYLKGYSDEEILLGKVGDAYVEITKKITAFNTAQALSSQVAENRVKIVALEFQERERALVIAQKQLDLEKAKENTIDAGARVAGQLTATNSDAVLIQAEINKLTKETLESADKRVELENENLFINQKVSGEIKKAGGLIDNNNDKVKQGGEKLNRVFDENILFLERFGNEADKNKEKIDSLAKSLSSTLEQEQKALFETIATLRQGPANLINAVQLSLAAQRLSEIDALIGSIASKRQNTELPAIDESQLTGLELPTKQAPGLVQKFEDEIARLQQLIKVTTDTKLLDDYQEQLSIAQSGLSALLDKNILKVEDLAQAFTGLGSVIGRAFNNPQLGTFLGQFAQFVAKIVAGSFAVAKANAVAGATQSSLFTGPAAAFTLPAFIASSVGLVASAFAALGNFGGGGGGGSVSAGQGSTFTNRREFGGPVSKGRAYIVGEKRPELFVPNTNGVIIPQVPSMDYSSTSVSSGMYGVEVMLKGPDDLLFFVEQAQVRRNIR